MTSLWAVFLTGLIAGGLSCLAVQGGLLAATIAQQEDQNALPILSFLGAKLVAYTIFGFMLGWFGSLFQLSLTMQIIMQSVVVIFMLGTAFNILEIHPIFRYFVIQPPRFVTKLVRNQSKSRSIFAPAILGAFTVFIPCGTTQAMMALAIGSASPILGASILFAFVLGTSPLFFVVGYFATKLGNSMQKAFMTIAAITLIVLALFNLNNVLALAGSDLSVQTSTIKQSTSQLVSEATIEFTPTAYIPQSITIKAGSEVTLNLINKTGSGCIQAFTIPKLKIQKVVGVGTQEKVTFTAPSEPGQIPFMCSMGMYRGVINVVK